MDPVHWLLWQFHWNYSADNIPGSADHSLELAEYNSDSAGYNSDFADHTPVHTHSCLVHHRKYSAPDSHFCMDRSDMNLPHPLLCWFCRLHIFFWLHFFFRQHIFFWLHFFCRLLYLCCIFCYVICCLFLHLWYRFHLLYRLLRPAIQGKTYNYPVSPDNSSYISSSLPRFHKSQFSLSQSTDQFAHLFVLRLYFLYHNINITKKLVSSLKINTFLFPNGFLPSVLQFPHQDNPEDNFSDLPACPDALLWVLLMPTQSLLSDLAATFCEPPAPWWHLPQVHLMCYCYICIPSATCDWLLNILICCFCFFSYRRYKC